MSACTCLSLFCFSTRITSSKLQLVHNRKLSQKWIIIVNIILYDGFLVIFIDTVFYHQYCLLRKYVTAGFKMMVTIKQKSMLSTCNHSKLNLTCKTILSKAVLTRFMHTFQTQFLVLKHVHSLWDYEKYPLF